MREDGSAGKIGVTTSCLPLDSEYYLELNFTELTLKSLLFLASDVSFLRTDELILKAGFDSLMEGRKFDFILVSCGWVKNEDLRLLLELTLFGKSTELFSFARILVVRTPGPCISLRARWILPTCFDRRIRLRNSFYILPDSDSVGSGIKLCKYK